MLRTVIGEVTVRTWTPVGPKMAPSAWELLHAPVDQLELVVFQRVLPLPLVQVTSSAWAGEAISTKMPRAAIEATIMVLVPAVRNVAPCAD